MRILTIELGTLILRWTVVALFLMVCNDCTAQIQQAWVARYNNGISNGTNQAVKMALDAAGNIYVTGFSQNSNSQLGYVTIKYAPNGNQLWVTRYDSTSYTEAKPVAMALDSNNNIFVTGSALTVKYDSNGNQLWTAPYAGTTLACGPAGDVYVGGFGTNFNTVKLAPSGTNVWLTTYGDVGPTISQSVLVDSGNNVYVSGLDAYYLNNCNECSGFPYVTLTTIKYAPNGTQIWKTSESQGYVSDMQVNGAVIDSSNDLYLVSSWDYSVNVYITSKYASDGNVTWTKFPAGGNVNNTAYGLPLTGSNNLLLVGQLFHS